jgi:hypothetical protein
MVPYSGAWLIDFAIPYSGAWLIDFAIVSCWVDRRLFVGGDAVLQTCFIDTLCNLLCFYNGSMDLDVM